MAWRLATSRRHGGPTSVCISRRRLEKRFLRLVRKFPSNFMYPSISLQYLQSVPLVPIRSQMNPMHSFRTYCLKAGFNTTLRWIPSLQSVWFIFVLHPNKTLHPTRATYPVHLTVCDLINGITILLSITNKMQRYTIFFITVNALHVSGGFSAHHQELKTVHTISGMYQSCLLLPLAVAASKLDIYQMLRVQFWAPDDGWRNRLEHVEHWQ